MARWLARRVRQETQTKQQLRWLQPNAWQWWLLVCFRGVEGRSLSHNLALLPCDGKPPCSSSSISEPARNGTIMQDNGGGIAVSENSRLALHSSVEVYNSSAVRYSLAVAIGIFVASALLLPACVVSIGSAGTAAVWCHLFCLCWDLACQETACRCHLNCPCWDHCPWP